MKQRSWLEQNFVYIVILTICGIAARISYASSYPYLHIFPDSYGYMSIGQNIASSLSLSTLINPYRPPLYPIYLQSILTPFGIQNSAAETIILSIQTTAGILAMILYYAFILHLLKHRILTFFITLTQITAVNLMTWERSMLTESFAIPLTISFGVLSVQATIFPTWKKLIFLLILSILSILVRPSFIIFPIIIFPLIAIYHKKQAVMVRVCVISLIMFLYIAGYISINMHYHGYAGIQNGSDINILGKILQFRIPLESASEIHPLYERALEYQKNPSIRDVWDFINKQQIDVTSADGLQKVRAFNSAVISRHPVLFFLHTFYEIPKSMVATHHLYQTPAESANIILTLLYWIFVIIQYAFLFTLPLLFFAWIRLCGKISLREAQATITGTIAFGNILLTAIAGEAIDYARFNGFIQPLLALFLAYWIITLLRFISRRIHKLSPQPSTGV